MAKFGRSFSRIWSKLARSRPTLARSAQFPPLQPSFGHISAIWTGVGPIWVKTALMSGKRHGLASSAPVAKAPGATPHKCSDAGHDAGHDPWHARLVPGTPGHRPPARWGRGAADPRRPPPHVKVCPDGEAVMPASAPQSTERHKGRLHRHHLTPKFSSATPDGAGGSFVETRALGGRIWRNFGRASLRTSDPPP